MAKKKPPSAAEIKKFTAQTLKSGSKGPAVGYLQEQLNQNGAKIDVDQQFGSGTKGAVKTFQKKKSLSADGIVGPKTWAAIDGRGSVPTPKEEKPEKQDKNRPNENECVVKLRVVCPAPRGGKKPVQGAKVRIGKQNKRTATNGDAVFNLPPGRHTAEVTKRGLDTDNDGRPIDLRTVAGGEISLEIPMKEST